METIVISFCIEGIVSADTIPVLRLSKYFVSLMWLDANIHYKEAIYDVYWFQPLPLILEYSWIFSLAAISK